MAAFEAICAFAHASAADRGAVAGVNEGINKVGQGQVDVFNPSQLSHAAGPREGADDL